MRNIADANGVDLLLIDTGDRVEGNGLYDGSEPKGQYTFDIVKQQAIDIICAGNHELYKPNSSLDELYQTVPNFKGRYLASNLDIHNPETGDLQALAPRYKKFVTKNQGIRVTAFGFIFNFQGSSNNTVVQPVQEAIKEQWFVDAIRDKDVDLFLVAGHVPVRNSEEYDAIFKAIRSEHWDTPIQFFGGHTHIRDYKKYDKAAVAIESGRYMETLGFQSISGLRTGAEKGLGVAQGDLTFQRRYIDNNLYSLFHHSHTNESTFFTALGNSVTRQIDHARKELNLDLRRGCAPQDYWMTRVPANETSSIFRLLGEEILPDAMRATGNASSLPKIVLTNTGAIRFDIFQGPFTRDSEYLISPFTSGFRYIKDVDWSAAQHLIQVLNKGGQIFQGLDMPLAPPENRAVRADRVARPKQTQPTPEQVPLGAHLESFPGYITYDDDGDEGDDTVHEMIDQYHVPNCIQSNVGFPADDARVDRVDVIVSVPADGGKTHWLTSRF